MRHQTKQHTLGKAPDQRKALLRSLATELLTHDEIKTTMARAKALQPYAENLITLAKKGDLNSRRLASSTVTAARKRITVILSINIARTADIIIKVRKIDITL